MLRRNQLGITYPDPVSKGIAATGMLLFGGIGFVIGTGIQLLFTATPFWPISLVFAFIATGWLYGVELGKLRNPSSLSFGKSVLRKLVLGLLVCPFAIAGSDFYFHHRAVDWGHSFSSAAGFVLMAVALDLLLIGLPAWIFKVKKRKHADALID